MNDHDARITVNEDDIDDLRHDTDIHRRCLADVDRRLHEIESALRWLLSRR